MIGRKYESLECSRGIASIIVVLHHYALAFLPALKNPVMDGGLLYTPLYAFINGDAAVLFFFVLSGFVLSVGLYEGSALKFATSVVKRLPRLMLPASITIIAGYLLLRFGTTSYSEAAALTGSQWLADFGNARWPAGFTPSLPSALKECLWVFLLPRNFAYNSNLWTMFDEFYGSVLVFAMVAFHRLNTARPDLALITVQALLFAAAMIIHPAFAAFVAGSALAFLIVKHDLRLSFSGRQTAVMVSLAFVCFSVPWKPTAILASALLMAVLLGNENLASRLSGPAGRLVGVASFPLYLVHALVVLTLSSVVFVWADASLGRAAALGLTLIATLSFSALFCAPLILLERFWVPWLNKASRAFVEAAAERVLARQAA